MTPNSSEVASCGEPPQLNPELDRAQLAGEFRQHGRIQVQNILTASSAKRIHACLKDETP
jgi:hypothetical protein